MKRIISGVKPTGVLTLGNYLGTMKGWPDYQVKGSEVFYFIANLHALNIRQSAEELRQGTIEVAAWLLALGIDPDKSCLFVESQVSAHAQLMTILNNYVTMGELSRMTQFKDKSQKTGPEGQVAGLFEYPVLMAADILLYDIDEVPVGDDQRQHVEITRDIASRFNNLYGETFKLPQAAVQTSGARIMDLQDPSRKMSKSDVDNGGCIYLYDSADQIRTKIMKSVTDSGGAVEFSDDKAAISNLLLIYSLVSNRDIRRLESDYAGKGYGEFKADLADAVCENMAALQGRYRAIMAKQDSLTQILADGQKKANAISEKKLSLVKEKIGLL